MYIYTRPMPAVKIFYPDAVRFLNRVFLTALRAAITIAAWPLSSFVALVVYMRCSLSIVAFAEFVGRVRAIRAFTPARSPLRSLSFLPLPPLSLSGA